MTATGPVTVRLATAEDHDAAVEVWREANNARGRPPSPARVDRVRAKLSEPGAIVLVAAEGQDVRGMLLGEPGREGGGQGPRIRGLCHISMVFVHPHHQARGLGRLLLDGLRERAGREGYTRLQVWTGTGNERARRLYRRAGFTRTGEPVALEPGRLIDRFVADLPAGNNADI